MALPGAGVAGAAQFTDIARRSRDLLLAKHATNPAALGAYGFDVIEALAAAPKGQL